MLKCALCQPRMSLVTGLTMSCSLFSKAQMSTFTNKDLHLFHTTNMAHLVFSYLWYLRCWLHSFVTDPFHCKHKNGCNVYYNVSWVSKQLLRLYYLSRTLVKQNGDTTWCHIWLICCFSCAAPGGATQLAIIVSQWNVTGWKLEKHFFWQLFIGTTCLIKTSITTEIIWGEQYPSW